MNPLLITIHKPPEGSIRERLNSRKINQESAQPRLGRFTNANSFPISQLTEYLIIRPTKTYVPISCNIYHTMM